MSIIVKLVLAVLAAEALVELWKKAAPLQKIKDYIVSLTPFFYSTRQQTHMLECPYCFSVYVGVAMIAIILYVNDMIFMVIAGSLAVHRVSNYVHLVFSLLRDVQFEIRRGRR